MQFEVLWRSWSGASVESTSSNSVGVALNTNTLLFFCSYIRPVMYSSLFSLSWFPFKNLSKCDLLPILPFQNERSGTFTVLHPPAPDVVSQKYMPDRRSAKFPWNIKLFSGFIETNVLKWHSQILTMQCGKAYMTLLAQSIRCAQIKNVNLQILKALVESI